MQISRSSFTYLAVAALTLLVGCKGAEAVCDPTDPLCGGGGGGGGGGGAVVANVEVTSPIDTVMAVGRQVQLAAAATDVGGSPVTTTFTWNSTNQAAATVGSAGLVSAIAAGVTMIEATSTNNITGDLRMRAVPADLGAISAALTDPFTLALVAALDASTASTVNGLVSVCAGHIGTGHVQAIDQCLIDLMGTGGANTNDDALLGVLALFLDYAQRQLQL